MNSLINVLNSIIKDSYILRDENSKIIYPNDKKKIALLKKIGNNPKDVLDTTFDVVNKKWYSKRTKRFTYNNKKYVLNIYENKTKEVQLYKNRELELYVDTLTSVYRREMTYLKADEYIEYALANKESFAIITTDIDNFKSVNDTYGHATGDRVLKFIAKELYNSTRHRKNCDIVGRIGGDEFFMLLKNIKEEKINTRLEQIKKHICSDLIKRRSKLKLTCSYGAYFVDMDDYTTIDDISKFREEIYQKADQALYNSKRNGKNRITVYNKNTKLD